MATSFKLLIIVIAILSFTSCSKQVRKIFTETSDTGNVSNKDDSLAINSINLKVDMELIHTDSNKVLDIPLPDKKALLLIRKRIDKFENGRMAWYGIIDKDPGSFALLSITKNAIVGKITTSNGKIYRINYLGKNVHQLSEINEGKFLEKKDDATVPVIKKNDSGNEGDCPDPATNIDALVVYTDAAETGAGGADGIEALIYQCVYLTNLSYQNSNINQRLNLVHFEKVTYTESGVSSTDKSRLQNPSDGFMDNVQTLRNTYGADVVALLVETLDYCGEAYIMSPVQHAFETYAFAVIKRSCAADNLSFPHELGHIMGARHSCDGDGTIGTPYDYDHGYFVSTPADGSSSSWRTIMAYANCTSGACTRIPYFSNPSLNYSPTSSASVDAMGTAAIAGSCTCDNHQVLNNTASTVANFRCSAPSVGNVWMRDTWDDTGLEPDSHTTGEDMWKSPYIWIRNNQDPGFLNQFQHQNPIFGQPNWIYVKLINGGAAETGNLEVYYANASVSLTWPAGWTLISNPSVTINANSSKVVEIPWNTLPGTGHYCLVARWNSISDPMGFTETSDIDFNTRRSNNIIWRNLNIVDMGGDRDESAVTININNNTGNQTSIEFDDEALFPKHAFIETGKIFISLDTTLLAAWRQGGSKGIGIKEGGGKIQITAQNATLDNILLPKERKAVVTISFIKNKNTIADKYSFNVKQFIQNSDTKNYSAKKISGGVSYEIYTYKR